MIECTITDNLPIAAAITGDAMVNGILEVTRGESASLDLYFTTLDAAGLQIALDLTGAVLHFRVKSRTGDANETGRIVKNSPATGIVVAAQVDPTVGHATLSLAPADTAAMVPGRYAYEVRIVQAGGFTRTAARGTFRILGEVVNL